ncbi:hypothetical protein ACTXT7_006655 [Hymenolepis weldensis]
MSRQIRQVWKEEMGLVTTFLIFCAAGNAFSYQYSGFQTVQREIIFMNMNFRTKKLRVKAGKEYRDEKKMTVVLTKLISSNETGGWYET